MPLLQDLFPAVQSGHKCSLDPPVAQLPRTDAVFSELSFLQEDALESPKRG